MEKRGADGVWYMFLSTEGAWRRRALMVFDLCSTAQRGAWRRGALMVFDICSLAQRGRGEEGR